MIKRIGLVLVFLALAIITGIAGLYIASQPKQSGQIQLAGLQQPVTVSFDPFAHPVINADSKADAYFTLGYLTARERLFQMDLMRRKLAGRLSEIIGPKALPVDIAHRHLRLSQLAERVVSQLPESERLILNAYVQGVNAYLQTQLIRPLECLLLGYQPEPWRAEDSLLVSLGMFQLLNDNAETERMLTVMAAALPEDAWRFFTPSSDIYNHHALLQEPASVTPDELSAIPVHSLSQLITDQSAPIAHGLVDREVVQPGSNQWATQQTADGRAIMANDMHLPLSVPGIWYQADLRYPGVRVKGITLPGMPLMIAGSNGSIAWGFTNAQADVLDLVQLTLHPDRPDHYLTGTGWQPFDQTTEMIHIKGEADHPLTTQATRWGPVSAEPLMGQSVAIQWSLYQPGAVNLDLLAIDQVDDLDRALDLFNRAGLPPLNVVLADAHGQIAWTLTGKIPQRVQFEGAISRPRSQSPYRWEGFIDAADYPRVVNPASGSVITANNRVLPRELGFEYGRNFANSYRAYRIQQWLQDHPLVNAQDMYDLQLDTRSELYEFYQHLAESVLTDAVLQHEPTLTPLKQALAAWNGHADQHSVGYGILVAFRQGLADTLFSSYLHGAQTHDPGFRYRWHNLDTPLRALLTMQHPATLPAAYRNWHDLILSHLRQVHASIQHQHADQSVSDLTWGEMARMRIQHPFGAMHPLLGQLLNMADEPQVGCTFCVRVMRGDHGASMRLVVSPGYEDEMILVTPTGQSGHPLSPHYQDQHRYWVSGQVPQQTPDGAQTVLTLLPG